MGITFRDVAKARFYSKIIDILIKIAKLIIGSIAIWVASVMGIPEAIASLILSVADIPSNGLLGSYIMSNAKAIFSFLFYSGVVKWMRSGGERHARQYLIVY